MLFMLLTWSYYHHDFDRKVIRVLTQTWRLCMQVWLQWDVTVWGCFAARGSKHLVIIERTTNSKVHRRFGQQSVKLKCRRMEINTRVKKVVLGRVRVLTSSEHPIKLSWRSKTRHQLSPLKVIRRQQKKKHLELLTARAWNLYTNCIKLFTSVGKDLPP